jgi:hypothetical protein
MRGFVAVVRRELGARRLALVAAAAMSVLPFAIPLSRGLTGTAAREAREVAAMLLAVGFAAALSVSAGWSSLSRDLAERRMGFDFSRPLSGLSIWAGRLVGAFLAAVGSAALLWVPSWIAGGGSTLLDDLPRWAPWAALAGSAVLVLVFSAAGIALRSHSTLLLLDVLALSAAAASAIAVTRGLLRSLAVEPLRYGLAGLAVILAIGFLAAGLAAVLRGRTDLRAAHRALSPWLWTALAAGLCTFAGYSRWVLSAGPAELRGFFWVSPAPNGPWIAVGGIARGAPASFLIDTATGTELRIFSPDQPVFLSGDGKRAAWFAAEGDPAPFALTTASLGAPPIISRSTRVKADWPRNLALSDDGSEAAILSKGLLTILDTASGRSLVSARLAEQDVAMAGAFLAPGLFRAFLWGNTRLDIFELDGSSRRLTRTGSLENLLGWYYFCVDSTKKRLLVSEKSGSRVRLVDARTGVPLATLADGEPQDSSWVSFLADGRIVLATANRSGAPRVRLFAADGAPGLSIELPPAPHVRIGGEIAPGKLAVATRGEDSDWQNGTLYIADLDAGAARKVADGLYPVGWFPMWSEGTPAGAEATKLFYGPGHSLVQFDPFTGQRRVLLQAMR